MWLLAVGLRSGLVYDGRASNRERYHDSNTHTQWRNDPGDYQRSVLEILRRHGPGGLTGAAMRMKTRAELMVELGPSWLREPLRRRALAAGD